MLKREHERLADEAESTPGLIKKGDNRPRVAEGKGAGSKKRQKKLYLKPPSRRSLRAGEGGVPIRRVADDRKKERANNKLKIKRTVSGGLPLPGVDQVRERSSNDRRDTSTSYLTCHAVIYET